MPSSEESNDKQVFLEDMPPKFEEREPPAAPSSSQFPPRKTAPSGTGVGTPIMPPSQADPDKSVFKQAVSTVQMSDFAKVNEIPCFRKAMLTGGALGAIAFGVLITTRWPVKRALNWGVAGLTIGAIGSWEQCRFQIRQEKKNTYMAREIYRQRGGKDGEPPSA